MKKNSCFIFFQFWASPLQLLLCEPGGKSGLGDKASRSEEETRQGWEGEAPPSVRLTMS